MFSQWLRGQVCKHYGHHYWVTSGVDTTVNEEDDSLDVYLTVCYGDCKRCGTAPTDPRVGSWKTHNVTVADFTATVTRSGGTMKIEHKVEAFDIDQQVT